MPKMQRGRAGISRRNRRAHDAGRASIWQLQDAKQKLSEVMQRALSEGPQHITLHGRPAGVLLSEDEYARLGGEALTESGTFRSGKDLIDWFRKSAFFGATLDLKRSKDVVRKVSLGEES